MEDGGANLYLAQHIICLGFMGMADVLLNIDESLTHMHVKATTNDWYHHLLRCPSAFPASHSFVVILWQHNRTVELNAISVN